MSEFSTSNALSNEQIIDLLKTAYIATDQIGQIMTADIPVRSPVYGGRYERMVENAGIRYEEAVTQLSMSPELQELSEAIHNSRCGCTQSDQRGDCDWYIAGQTSTTKSRRMLQAGELMVSGFTIDDITDYPEVFNKWIDYLEAPREERPKLQAELEVLVATTE